MNLKNMVLVERDYKGEYERYILTKEDFKKDFPVITPSTESDTHTYKPFCHIWFKMPETADEVHTFLTDMEDGLPESDIDNGNVAYLRNDMFSEEFKALCQQGESCDE